MSDQPDVSALIEALLTDVEHYDERGLRRGVGLPPREWWAARLTAIADAARADRRHDWVGNTDSLLAGRIGLTYHCTRCGTIRDETREPSHE